MWKYREEAEEQISLHDCRATQMTIEENRICIGFSDGFWVIANTPHNPSGETLKTTKSQLVFHLNPQYADDVEVHIFRRKQLRGKNTVDIRERKDLLWLMRMINVHGAQLEFIDEYGCYRRRLYICDLLFKHPPYRLEFQLDIPAIQKMEYCWNEIDSERVW